jgi:hypothetical protein
LLRGKLHVLGRVDQLSSHKAGRYSSIDKSLLQTLSDPGSDLGHQLALDDLCHRIRSIKSACQVELEREAQRWLTESFIDAEFCLRRHEACNAAMLVYSLSHHLSRKLYDETILAIRREVWDESKHAPMDCNSLKGTRGLPLLRYTNFLTPAEFSKLVALLKDLAPSLIVLVKPTNEARIRAGEWEAVRENLLIILNGDSAATPLFG